MPVAKQLSDVPFDKLKPGQTWHLIDFTPEMLQKAHDLLRKRATDGGFVPIIRNFPSNQIVLNLTPEALEARREKKRAKGALPGPRGRREGIEARLIRALEVDGEVVLNIGTRHPHTIRNLATTMGRKLKRNFKVTKLEDGEYKVTRNM